MLTFSSELNVKGKVIIEQMSKTSIPRAKIEYMDEVGDNWMTLIKAYL